MKNINEKYISVRGKVAITDDLEMGQDVTVTVTVDSIEDKDLNDGSVKRTYKAILFAPSEFDGAEINIVQNLKGSLLLRNKLYGRWCKLLETGKTDKTFEKYYDRYIQSHIDEIDELNKTL